MTETSTAVEHVQRSRELDLSRAPWEQWHPEMVELMKKTVLTKAASNSEVYFCLALADSLGLSPFAGEVFFIPQKARDGDSGGVKPYVGREGLVKKATERGCYFEAETVCSADRFRVVRKSDGTKSCTHSYGHESERGDIVGAYAFLHSKDPAVKPEFFYAPLDEYLPSFDQDWKMGKSPWGNQRSSMIQKCAMIGAGRKRLNLAGVLIDAEVDRYMQQQSERVPEGGGSAGPVDDFDFATIGDDIVAMRLREAVEGARARDPEAWPSAKCQMSFTGRSNEELTEMAERIEAENEAAGPVEDAVVVTPEMEAIDELRRKEQQLAHDLGFAQSADEEATIRAELDQVRARIRQLGGGAPGQESLDIDS